MKLKVFVFLLLLSSVSVSSQTKADDALKSLVKQFTEAQTAYDAVALDKILTADYIEISPAGEFDPREKVLGFYKPELKPPADKMTATTETTDFSIRVYDKFAVVIARFNYTIVSEGKQLPPRSIRATIVCRKEKTAWKIASAQYTGIRK
ncbi:MAG TPA: nuclear transport factor 2 family protein [Pyrinomonadaceae bacterium]|jgi:ketosteroid isomerase-like protein